MTKGLPNLCGKRCLIELRRNFDEHHSRALKHRPLDRVPLFRVALVVAVALILNSKNRKAATIHNYEICALAVDRAKRQVCLLC